MALDRIISTYFFNFPGDHRCRFTSELRQGLRTYKVVSRVAN